LRAVKRSTAIGALLGLVLGAGGVLLLASLSTGDTGLDASVPTTSTTDTVVASGPVWVDPAETVIGPAVIVPDSLRLEDDEVVFRYELTSLAPIADLETALVQVNPQSAPTEIGPDDLDPIFPIGWTITAAGEPITGVTSNARARSARFSAPAGFALSSIESLALDGYRIPVPVNLEFQLEEGEPTEIAPGVSVSVVRITSQSGQTILQVEIQSEDPENREHLTIEGTSAEWLSAVREAEGRPRYTLRHAGEALPAPLILRARGFVWLPVERSIEIQLDADR